MAGILLQIEDLHAGVEGKEILKGLDLMIRKGEVHVILGPNGSGKSTLMNVIMGPPKYEVTGGNLMFEGEDIGELRAFERARRGLFLAFQSPEEIPGITVENMIRTARQMMTGEKIKLLPFRKELNAMMEELQIDPSYAQRYLNVGFSGGERCCSSLCSIRNWHCLMRRIRVLMWMQFKLCLRAWQGFTHRTTRASLSRTMLRSSISSRSTMFTFLRMGKLCAKAERSWFSKLMMKGSLTSLRIREKWGEPDGGFCTKEKNTGCRY